LSGAQLAAVEQALLEGTTAKGCTGALWSLDRIALVIWRLTGIWHHPAQAGRWSTTGWLDLQRPRRRATERDHTAVERWAARDRPAIKQPPNDPEPAWPSPTNARSA
jgi:transposase